MAYSDLVRGKLDDLYSTAGAAVSDLSSGVVAGEPILASQFADVRNALQDLQDFVDEFRVGYYYTPVGVVVPFAGSSDDRPPAGWYLCNGDSFATVELSSGDSLYDLLVGAGWSALPDLKGRTVLGAGTGSGLSARALRDVLGAESLPAHTHPMSHTHGMKNHTHGGTTGGESGHTHTFNAQTYSGASGGVGGVLRQGGSYSTAGAVATHTHGFSTGGPSDNTTNDSSISNTDSTGSGTHGVMQPSVVLNYLIKG